MGLKQYKWLIIILNTMVLAFSAACGSAPMDDAVKRPSSQKDRAIRPKASLREEAVNPDMGRWAVVIGISDYKYDTHWDKQKGIPDLRYADRDARAFARFLMSPQGGAFPEDHVLLLTDRNATASEVRNAIGGFLAKSLEDDLVIIFFAGHGVPDPDNPENLYLACYDTVPGKYYGTAFPMWGIDDALRRTIHSKRVFVIADACHSAGVGGARGGDVSGKFNAYLEKLAASREGVTKVTASRADELSLEKDYLGGGHGVFTYYLLEALEGRGDRNRNGFVTMDEAYDYLYDKVRSETRHSQKPWVSGYVSSDIPLGIVDSDVLAAVEKRATNQSTRRAASAPISRPTPMPELPKDSQVAVKLARAKLAKDQPGTALDMAEAVIRRNDSVKPDALALKIAILLQDGDLKAAEDAEDLLVIPYPDHPAAKKGAGRVYDYYLKELQGRTPAEQIQAPQKYIKRHPGGLMTAHAQKKLGEIQSGVRTDYDKRFRESLTLAEGFIHQNRFERARKELNRARDMAKEAFSGYGISLDTRAIADLRLESETREKAYRARMFEEKCAQAKIRFQARDYTSAYRFLKEAREYGDPAQLSRADALARKYNAPPDVSIAINTTTVDWERPVSFTYRSSDREGDPVRVVEWDFGDGTSSEEEHPKHAYGKWRGSEKERHYRVTLKATDGHSTVTAEKVITVKKQDRIKTFTVNGVSFKMVRIPAGEFMMGSPSNESGRDGDEGPQHRVRITKPFWMGETEVTQGLWQAVMGNNPSRFSNCGDDCPVEKVSWNDCREFIKALNAKVPSGKFRLPTEAEWEYACRAGTTGPYAGDLNAMGWYGKNSGGKTHLVARKQPNAWGLYDMHGNVWEWCRDWYGGYPSGTVTDPAGPSSGAYRVNRGGSWYNSARCCRSAYRYRYTPGFGHGLLGFCLARTH